MSFPGMAPTSDTRGGRRAPAYRGRARPPIRSEVDHGGLRHPVSFQAKDHDPISSLQQSKEAPF